MFQSSVRVLSDSEMDQIHVSAVRLLRNVGVRVDHARMRALLAEAGCQIHDAVVRFPEAVTETVVEKMRDPANTMHGYVGTLPLRRSRIPREAKVVPVATGQATTAHDLESDGLRPATRQDLADACRVTDALPGVITAHPVFLPQDAPEMARDLFALQTVAEHYPYSDFVEIYSPEVVPYFLEMGRVIRGSDEALREDPPFCSWAFATPPFQFGQHGFEILFQLRDFGLRQGFGVGGVMQILGASTPLTIAGYLVTQTAEVLACNIMNWALSQQLAGYSAGPATIDMRLGTPSQSAPEVLHLFLATMELQRYYGADEPVFPYALNSDAKMPDIQAGLDKGMSAMLAVLAGSRVLSAGLGTLALSGVASLAQLLIDYELCRALDHLMRGFVVDDAHLATDLIEQVGIGGSFLAEEHSVAHLRETVFKCELFDRSSAGQWQEKPRSMLDRAKERVRQILTTESPRSYLSPEQAAELNNIARHAARRLGGE